MKCSLVNGFQLNNLSKISKTSSQAYRINQCAQFDTVSFSGKRVYFDGYKGERNCDDYAFWLISPEDEYDELSMTPIEKAFESGETNYIANAIDKLSIDKCDSFENVHGCDKDLRDEVVFYCLDLINEESVYYDNEYIKDTLSAVLDRADDKMLLEIKDEERCNNILSNLVSSNNVAAIETLFEKCDNKTIALLMLQKNDDEQYPIGEYDGFTKTRKILGRERLAFDDIPLFNKRKILPKTTFILRKKAIELLQDETLSQRLKNKIKEVYVPNKVERKNLAIDRFAREFE